MRLGLITLWRTCAYLPGHPSTQRKEWSRLTTLRFFVPMTIFLGDPHISIGFYIWKSMIPSLIGNLIGGCLLVATIYWYLNLTGQPPVLVDGVAFQGSTSPLIGRSEGCSTPGGHRSSHEDKTRSDENMV